jgi:Putative auto-transporter adhesin, head GIN domain
MRDTNNGLLTTDHGQPFVRPALALACALLVAVLAGCDFVARKSDGVVGSGNRKTEERSVAEFDEIVVEGAYQVEVTCGQPLSLRLEADDNILPLIRTEVEGRRLRITQARGMSLKSMPVVRIGVPDLKVVSIPGASDFRLSGVRNDALKIGVEGAARLRASGETGTLDLTLSGAGLIDARELRARSAAVVSNGAGLTSVYATESLDATVNGIGSIDYYGDPKAVSPQINGIGRINKK